MRMTASWLGSKRTCRIQVWWREAAPQWRAPLGLIPKDKRCPTPQLKKPVSGHHPSACSANLIAGDGTRNGLSAPNKEPAQTKKPLDRKTPIQVSNKPGAATTKRN